MLRVLPPTCKPVLQQIRLQVAKTLLQKVESSFTFCNKICTCCAFYSPKANLSSLYGVTPRNCIQSEVSINATCSNLYFLQERFEGGC